jgi:hypothetical protein
MRGLIIILSLLFLFSCEENSVPGRVTGNSAGRSGLNNAWAVDTARMTGTSVRNTFPIVMHPEYSSVDKVSLTPNDKVIVLKVTDEVYVYPLRFMGIEVLNDSVSGKYFAATYCPITESSLVWNRKIEDEVLTFAASGVLYQENLVPYDLETRSMWSQMLMRGINGKHIFSRPETFNAFETSWHTVKGYFPQAKVFPGNQEIDQNKYKKNEPVEGNGNSTSGNSDHYKRGEKVFGVFPHPDIITNPMVLTKSHEDFTEEISIDQWGNVIVVFSEKFDFIQAYKAENMKFNPVHNEFPVILKDEDGVKYDIFGFPVNRQDADQLPNLPSYSALWWAWDDFYNNFKKL